jgi:hypothetical protein
MLLDIFLIGALFSASSGATCTHQTVRTVLSPFGAEAIEQNRICEPNMFLTTVDNEVFVRADIRSQTKPVLIARLDSEGAIGVPLSWVGKRW